ncbi:uncharacterized protein LOC134817840 [Bolinopsis microptera]|uniref:uncharacterized protein LOC134817840 n=1 Tax=Bolinopsis microptera TaxID=2820187 RepID=UPI00307AD945
MINYVSTSVHSLISLLLLGGPILADLTYFLPGHRTVLYAGTSQAYLKDFTTVINTVNHTLTLTSSSDEGIYSPIVGNSTHSHILSEQTQWFSSASLCSYNLTDVLRDVPPTLFRPGSTAVVPCAVVGQPKPTIWWQVLVDGLFSNLTLDGRYFMSPNNHLIIKNIAETDSGTYRCVGWNECGSRCPTQDTCLTGQNTTGDPITITVSLDSVHPNKAFNLNNKLDPYTEYITHWYSCLMGDNETQCLYLRQFSKRQFGGNIDAVFIGDANFSSINRDDVDGSYGTNEFGICMFECLKNSSSEELGSTAVDIRPMDCTNIEAGEELSTNCFSVHVNISKFLAIAVNNLKFVPDIKLSRLEEVVTLTQNTTRIQFYTSRKDIDHGDMRDWTCYKNNKEIIPDKRTSVTKIVDRKNDRILFSINKDCLMRADIGDYYCKITDIAGQISLSAHTSVVGVDKFSCTEAEVSLQSRTTTSLLVSWSSVNDKITTQQDLVVQPYPCHPGDRECGGESVTVLLTSAQNLSNITSLTPGCCYSITVTKSSGSVLAENKEVSDFKTWEVPPKAQSTLSMQYNASYYQNDKLRIWWTAPERVSWGSDTLTFEITRGIDTYKISGRTYFVVDELLPEAQIMRYGQMRLCNPAGCSLHHEILVTVPYRPNKPRVELLDSGCRELKVNMSNEDTVTYSKYRYGVLKYTEDNTTLPEVLFTGNLSLGVNVVKYLKEGKRYNLKIWGINSRNSNTPLISVPVETESFCAREITIVTILAFILVVIGVMVCVLVERRRKDAMYTYTMNPTGENVFSDALEDDISIIHINHDQATTVKPSRNVLLRLKLSLGLKRLK